MNWHRIRFLESSPFKESEKDMKFNGKKDQRWQVSSDISKSHTHFQWEEPMYVRALQCHSSENVYMSTFSPNKIEKGDASLLYHVGFSGHEDPIKFRRLVPWGFRISKGRNAVYFSVVSPLDPNTDPKYKPYLHMKNHHERLFVMDLEAAQNSLGFNQTANGTVLCYDTVPSEFLTKIINLKDGSERFGKDEYLEEQVSPKKRSRHDHGQPRETSWHNTKQETIEPRQLRAISRTAEIIKENRSSEMYAQCTCVVPKEADGEQISADVERSLADGTAVQEKNAQVTDENGCQFIQSLVQLRIAEQVQRSQRHGTSKDQIYWTLMRDHFRRCTKSPTQSPNNRSVSKAELIAGIKRSIHGSHVHQRTFK